MSDRLHLVLAIAALANKWWAGARAQKRNEAVVGRIVV